MKPPSGNNYRNGKTSLIVFGVTITLLGIIIFFLKVWIMELITTSLLVLKPNNFMDNLWRKVPDIYTDLYFFDWTNPEDFNNLNIKPKFKEVGPYKFNQTIDKMDVVWNSNNTVTYSQRRSISFLDDINNGDLYKEVSTINIINLFMAHYARNKNYLLKKMLSTYLATSAAEVNMTITPQQFFFDGLDNFFFEMGKLFPFISPELPRFNKLSIIGLCENYKELEGVVNMDIGVDRIFNVYSWNYYNILPHYKDSCEKIRGTTGEMFSMDKSKQYIELFLSAVCRYTRLDFEEEVIVHGIRGYKYIIGSVLDNGTLIPGNECYCGGKCLPSGLVNVSSCLHGFPFFMSLPHFFNADPVYADSVEGLHPNKDKHEAYLVVEPTTGILLKSSGRIQVNIRISPIEDISMYENTREMIFPWVWLNQRSILPDYLLILLKIYLIFPGLLIGIASVLILFGLLLLCIAFKPVLVSWLNNLRRQKQSSMLMQEQIIPLRPSDSIVKTSYN